MKNRGSIMYKLIARYIFEIILIVAFMIVSYSGFTMNNLSEASKIANISSTETREIQIMYARTGVESVILEEDNALVDRGVLSIKNPNKTEKSMSVVIQLRKSESYDIGDIFMKFDNKLVESGVIMNLEDTYEIIVGEIDLEAYEFADKEIEIYNRKGSVPIEYSFKIVGSF